MGPNRQTAGDEPHGVAEVLHAVAVPQRGVELKVRLLEGRLVLGPASLTRRNSGPMLVSIRYCAIMHFTDPSAQELDVYFIGVTGVQIDDVEVGQQIIQPPSLA